MDDLKYRIIILGAGFSKPAGVPLAEELWEIILKRANHFLGRADKLNRDLKAYITYKKDCFGVEHTRENVDFEDFLGFLDVEHTRENVDFEDFLGFLDIEFYLGLRGSDTWSEDGNEGQVVVKTLIGEILTSYMPQTDSIPELYLEFAKRLKPRDYILTFNYDVLLERALDAIGKPYRLFPERYSSISRHSGTVDDNNEEVAIIKLHGSIDWFDKRRFIERIRLQKEAGLNTLPNDLVFNSSDDWGLSQIVDGPRFPDDALQTMYRVSRIEDFYKQDLMFMSTPWILPPSTFKILYARTLEEFWRGLGQSGGFNFGMAIIGYSLPKHDSYARQVIYSMARNYQNNFWGTEALEIKKSPLVLVDKKSSKSEIDELLNNYKFLNREKTELHMDGFNMEALDKVFQ